MGSAVYKLTSAWAYRFRLRRRSTRMASEGPTSAAPDSKNELGGAPELFSILCELTESLAQAETIGGVYDAALQALKKAAVAHRASVLTFDERGVARFRAWSGLSEQYRRAVEGHCPWKQGDRGAKPFVVPDVLEDPHWREYASVFRREGIRALAFIPLNGSSGVVGKFMLYHNEPHRFREIEVQLALVLASQVAHAVERVSAEEENRRQAARVAEQADLLNLAHDGIFALRMDGTIEFWNRGAERMYGWSAEEALGRISHELLQTVTPEPLASMKAKLVEGGIWEGELTHITKTGERRIVSSRWALRKDAQGRPGILEITRDITDQKMTELAHRETEERLALAVGSTQLGMFDAYPQSGKFMWTGLTKLHFGLLSGKPASLGAAIRAIHRDDRRRFGAAVRQILSGTATGDFSLEFRTIGIEDGQERWICAWGRSYRDTTGKPSRFIGVTLDISDRKRAERRFENVLNSIRESFIAIDWDFLFTYVNRRVAQELGMTREEIVGRSVWEVAPEYKNTAFYPNYRRVLEERTSARFEVSSIDGSRCWEVHAYPTENGLSAYILDVTSRMAAQRALSESERRYRSLIEALTAVVWGANASGTFGSFDGGWSAFTGQTLDEQIGNGWLNAIHPDDRVEFAAVWRSAIETGSRFSREARLWHVGTHEHRRVLIAAAPVMEDSGQVREWVGTVTDVHEQRLMEERLRQSAKLESLGILAGGIAHDFNNLLTGILGSSSLLRENAPPDSPLHFASDIIFQASERAAKLTREMLAYSGRGQFVIEPLDLSAQVSEIVTLVEASIPKEVQLEFALADNLPSVKADSGQLQQLVMNLVINAAEAIPGRGKVEIRTAQIVLERALPTQAGELGPGWYVTLDVRDNGAGMDSDTRARIFDPFFTTKFTGRGLGLAAALGIVRGHGGGIVVESAPGEGARFTVYLPAAVRSEEADSRTSLSIKRGGGSVLLIDDEEVVVSAAKAALESRGYRVKTASNGRTGVQMYAAAPQEFDLVLLDMTMPVMNGEEALPLLRAVNPNVCVLGSSGYTEQEATRRFGAGLTGFIQKPYSAQGLCDQVAALLNDSRTDAASRPRDAAAS